MTSCNSRFTLKYLFKATYKDKTQYSQNAQDISVEDITKSCYHDLKVSEVQQFELSDGNTNYTLDLRDGGITINGAYKFFLTSESVRDLKLLYFRRATVSLRDLRAYVTVNYNLGFTATSESGDLVSHSITLR